MSAHITTVGVRRPAQGTVGRPLNVHTNHFACKSPAAVISHYDVIHPSEKTLPARLNMDLITHLQTHVAPDVFTPRVVYDGRKNIFAPRTLSFGAVGEFEVTLADTRTTRADLSPDPSKPGNTPKLYKIKLTKVAEINPEVLLRFLQGTQSHDNSVLTAITALNVVIRMGPTIKYPFNARSFFTDAESKDIGSGLVLWRGYFQSVRPAVGRLLINVDISTGAMYKPGPLLDLCLEFINRPRMPLALTVQGGFPDRERIRLQRFIAGLRVVTRDGSGAPRIVKKLTALGAADLTFQLRDGGTTTVADYFHATYNKPLLFPALPCVEVGAGALLPLELCRVPPGQLLRAQLPSDKTRDVLAFATKRPADRLRSVRGALGLLKSEYATQFGVAVDAAGGPLAVRARVLAPPTLRYGAGSTQRTITPSDGAWNMLGKKFFKPAVVKGWVVVVYERTQRFGESVARDMIAGLRAAAAEVGMTGLHTPPLLRFENAQGDIGAQLLSAGRTLRAQSGSPPTLIVVVIPEGGTDIYTQIKHAGDCVIGVATQCLKSSKCFRAKPQYYANVCLKINVKLGGINTIPEASSVPFLSDAREPTIVMGADVVHPAPGTTGRPSFAALVASVDSATAKYVATSRPQTSRQEMIDDLEEMAHFMLDMNIKYRQSVEKKGYKPPTRILFYRDGVSEGQFKTVLETEVPRIKAACTALGLSPLPKLTVIVVGKRHHVRFFPQAPSEGDRSGNCPAGTVIDRDVTHPIEFDFYLQSHGGLLGTSRPAHYSVLYDENGFTADSLQQLSFALTHVYARATRSVSIPAPVYYADIVCARAKCHYPPTAGAGLSDSATQPDSAQAGDTLEMFKKSFRPLAPNAQLTMYFS